MTAMSDRITPDNLRHHAAGYELTSDNYTPRLLCQAADEIVLLEAKLARCVGLLRVISDIDNWLPTEPEKPLRWVRDLLKELDHE